jgi:hypothetical protein
MIPDKVHLVGSIALDSVEQVFKTAGTVQRPITHIHMPVPIHRSDDAYFQPLSGLRLKPGTELYLGPRGRLSGAGATCWR